MWRCLGMHKGWRCPCVAGMLQCVACLGLMRPHAPVHGLGAGRALMVRIPAAVLRRPLGRLLLSKGTLLLPPCLLRIGLLPRRRRCMVPHGATTMLC